MKMSLDLRNLAEERALTSSASKSKSISPLRSAESRRSLRSISLNEPFSPFKDPKDNETVKAARLAEADYKWNATRSRIPSGQFIPPRWVPDEEYSVCHACKGEFSWLNRRHHCRHCGHIHCAACCSERAMLPLEFGFEEPQRVCRACMCALGPQQEVLSETRGPHTHPLLNGDLDLGLDPAPWALRRLATLPY
ncbi:hypothetical protein EON64_20645, partial [archaeon]